MIQFYCFAVALLLQGALGFELLPWLGRRTRTSNRAVPAYRNQTQLDVRFMTDALNQAKIAFQHGEVPIGAVVVDSYNGKILGTGHNRVEAWSDASAHAELLALRQAGRRTKNWRLVNATLYSTLEPCPMCLAACQAFRISRIVYGAPDLRLGAIETHMRLLDVPHPSHTIEFVTGGVEKEASAEMMREFFRERRRQKRQSGQSKRSPSRPKESWWRKIANKLQLFRN